MYNVDWPQSHILPLNWALYCGHTYFISSRYIFYFTLFPSSSYERMITSCLNIAVICTYMFVNWEANQHIHTRHAYVQSHSALIWWVLVWKPWGKDTDITNLLVKGCHVRKISQNNKINNNKAMAIIWPLVVPTEVKRKKDRGWMTEENSLFDYQVCTKVISNVLARVMKTIRFSICFNRHVLRML